MYKFSIHMVWAWSKWVYGRFYSSFASGWFNSLLRYVHKWSKWYLLWFIISVCWTTIYCCVCISICLLWIWHIICTSYNTCKLLLSIRMLELPSSSWSSKFRLASSKYYTSSISQYWPYSKWEFTKQLYHDCWCKLYIRKLLNTCNRWWNYGLDVYLSGYWC